MHLIVVTVPCILHALLESSQDKLKDVSSKQGCRVLLGALTGDGRWVVVGGDDDVVLVGLGLEGVEEGLGVGQAKLLDQVGVCDKAISPAHCISQLAHTLNEEEGGGRDLQQRTLYQLLLHHIQSFDTACETLYIKPQKQCSNTYPGVDQAPTAFQQKRRWQ